jgi:hypothetical protein
MPGRTANIIPVLDRLNDGKADATAPIRTRNGTINVSSEMKEMDASGKSSWNTAHSNVESPTTEPVSLPENEYTPNAPSSTIAVLIMSSKEFSPPYFPRTSFVPIATGGARKDPVSFYNASQVLSMPVKTPRSLLPTTSVSLTNARLSHGAAYARPLPGKNQPIPVLDAVAVASFLQLDEPVSTSMPGTFQSVSEAEYPPSSSQLSSLGPLGSVSTVWPMSAPTSTSVVTVTRGQQWKEPALASVETAQAASTISAALSPSILPPSSLATSVVAATSTLPPNVATSANMNLQGASRLTPVARTLFIVFCVLGEYSKSRSPVFANDSRRISITCCNWYRSVDASKQKAFGNKTSVYPELAFPVKHRE